MPGTTPPGGWLPAGGPGEHHSQEEIRGVVQVHRVVLRSTVTDCVMTAVQGEPTRCRCSWQLAGGHGFQIDRWAGMCFDAERRACQPGEALS